MKITRLIVGILLAVVILQFALIGSVWIASFVVNNDPTDPLWNVMLYAQFAQLLPAYWLLLAALEMCQTQEQRDEVKAWMKLSGGTLKARFSVSNSRGLWKIHAPYAPRWMRWVPFVTMIATQTGYMLMLIVGIYLKLMGFLHVSNGSFILPLTGLQLIFITHALPVIYSRWRELSQPADPLPQT